MTTAIQARPTGVARRPMFDQPSGLYNVDGNRWGASPSLDNVQTGLIFSPGETGDRLTVPEGLADREADQAIAQSWNGYIF